MSFDKSLPHESKIFTEEGGTIWAKGCFDIHVQVGQNVKTGVYQSGVDYYPLKLDQPSTNFPLYACPRENPVCVSEVDCLQIGELIVNHSEPEGSTADKLMQVALCFSGT